MNPTTAVVTLALEDTTLMLDVGSIYQRFQRLPDGRKRRGIRYPLAVLLTVAVLAKLAGASQPSAMADWARQRAAPLADLFDLPRTTMPHPSTWTRVLGYAVPVEALDQVVAALSAPPPTTELPDRGSVVLTLDGKTLRGTIAAGAARGVHLLAAYQASTGVVLTQQVVAAKTNEIGAAPDLLAPLDLTGVVVTGDALHTQRALSTQIVQQGGDYFFWVKENQPTLLDDCVLLFEEECVQAGWSAPPVDFTTAQTTDKGHGRIEERVLTASSMLQDYVDWPYLVQVVKVERMRLTTQQETQEVAYGITSMPPDVANAARLLEVCRMHWQIENGLHYRRDRTLHEDASQVRCGQAPQVLAALNNLVCAIGAPTIGANLAAFQRRCAWQLDQWLDARGWEHPPHLAAVSAARVRVIPHRR